MELSSLLGLSHGRVEGGLALVELRAFAAVEEVDQKADDQPGEEPEPGLCGEASHEESAEEH